MAFLGKTFHVDVKPAEELQLSFERRTIPLLMIGPARLEARYAGSIESTIGE